MSAKSLAAQRSLPRLFSVALLALNDAELAQKLSAFRLSQTEKVLAKTLE